MLSPELLKILRCPETHQAISVSEPSLVEKLNQHISAGQLRNRAGQLVTEKIQSGLVRSDNKYLYPIRQDIPIMLIDEAIPLPV
jgi:uncharacterized protein YbaR (Trm112 family)